MLTQNERAQLGGVALSATLLLLAEVLLII